jgi:uncharacterized damage-inducible protein DinB
MNHHQQLFDQYLTQLYNEITEVPEDKLWSVSGSVINSPGTLALHLCGNIRFFIGAEIGGDGYIRKREEEFSAKISKEELLMEITKAKSVCATVLSGMDPSDLDKIKKFGIRSLSEPVSTGYFLCHLAAHLGYHTGQLNYFRRILC